MESTSLTKALGLLEATAGHPQGRSLAELAAEVGMPKPTAHRILKSLTTLGYLERPRSGVYRQSPLVQRLVSDAAGRHLVAAACTGRMPPASVRAMSPAASRPRSRWSMCGLVR